MCWLEQQTSALRVWLQGTPSPMLVTVEHGEILWANEAFEKLLGYSLYELVNKKQGVNWKDITIDLEDLESDEWLLGQIRNNSRKEYTITKRFRSKVGNAIEVVNHVQRYPSNGDIECFLVTVMPVENTLIETMRELRGVKNQVTEALALLTVSTPKPFHEKYMMWVKSNPIFGSIVTLTVFTFLFGDRVLEIFQKALLLLK
jgi:PAS domain S-box-containing protein